MLGSEEYSLAGVGATGNKKQHLVPILVVGVGVGSDYLTTAEAQ